MSAFLSTIIATAAARWFVATSTVENGLTKEMTRRDFIFFWRTR